MKGIKNRIRIITTSLCLALMAVVVLIFGLICPAIVFDELNKKIGGRFGQPL